MSIFGRKPKELPKFCTACGRAVEDVTKPSGLGRMHRVLRCPNWTHSEHLWLEVDEWRIPPKFDAYTGEPLA